MVELAIFSFCALPFSLKFLAAPILDAVLDRNFIQYQYYIKDFGKRKTYVIPMMYLVRFLIQIRIFIVLTSMFPICYDCRQSIERETSLYAVLLESCLYDHYGYSSSLCLFDRDFQDIGVDGWALTLLNEDNIAYASTIQNLGLLLGGILSYNLYIPLNSPKFCNQYLKSGSSAVFFPYLSNYRVLFYRMEPSGI